MRQLVFLLAAGVLAPAVSSAADPPAAVTDAIKAIKAVGPEGAGSEAAAKGWKALAESGAPALVPTLTAFDDATPRAANWLRSAVNAIVEEEENAGRVVSKIALSKFAADTKRNPAARRLAFELLRKQDWKAADAMLPDFLNDPSPELRRDAVAEALKPTLGWVGPGSPHSVEKLLTLYAAARDKDQVEQIAHLLKDTRLAWSTTEHFGYITEWGVSEAFDNKDEKGWAKAYDPETTVAVEQPTPGVPPGLGKTVVVPARRGWAYYQTSDAYGSVDLNQVVGEKKDVLAYASATLVAAEETNCQVRLASQNAIKVFVNGKEVYAKDEYHHGHKMDQHVAVVTLKKGGNEILVKVCQNNQPYDWTKKWEFSCRVCDSTGGKLPLKQVVEKDRKDMEVKLGELAPAPPKKEKEKEEKK